jgi:hypothetical protein
MSFDLDKIISVLWKCEIIKEKEVKEICNLFKKQMESVPNLQKISSPVSICGDIHGQ